MALGQEKRVDLFCGQGWITFVTSPFAAQVVLPHFRYVPIQHSLKDVSNVQQPEK